MYNINANVCFILFVCLINSHLLNYRIYVSVIDDLLSILMQPLNKSVKPNSLLAVVKSLKI